MPHYNWYDLTPYEKVSILNAQVFPTYSDVGSPIDNGQPGNPGESYIDTSSEALYFNIGGGQWIAAGGAQSSVQAPVIAGTDYLHMFIQRPIGESEIFSPVDSDWTIASQIGSALALDSSGAIVLLPDNEGTFAVTMQVGLTWTAPFLQGTPGFFPLSVFVGINKPNVGSVMLSANLIPVGTSGIGFTTTESRQGLPIHYVSDGGNNVNITGGFFIAGPAPFPAGGTDLELNLHVHVTNL